VRPATRISIYQCQKRVISNSPGTRRWAERAVAFGFLSVDDIRNGATKACTLLLEAGSPAPSPQQSAAVAPGERPDEAVELTDDS